jgi:GNAT superfamily N-acetyltransferase
MRVHDVVIRPATPEDAAGIALLLTELGYDNDPGSVSPRLERLLGSSQDTVLLALHGERPCGVATVHLVALLHRDGLLARVSSFVVTEADRRRGVGTLLLHACEEHARDSGAERLEIVAGHHRPEAHAFYARHGYASEGVRFAKIVAPGGAAGPATHR